MAPRVFMHLATHLAYLGPATLSLALLGCGAQRATADAPAADQAEPQAAAPEARAPETVKADVTTYLQCSDAVEWAKRKRHDCEWAGVLVNSAQQLQDRCDLSEQTTQIREAKLILAQCGRSAPEDMRSPEVQPNGIDPYRW